MLPDWISPDLVNFIITLFLSLLIGLEQRYRHYIEENDTHLFGTDRTYALLGLWGFVLFMLNRAFPGIYLLGMLILGLLLATYYFMRIRLLGSFGATSIIVALITYGIAPLTYLKEKWIVILIVTSVLILIELKEQFRRFVGKFDEKEFITLAKFLVISGIILPLLPDKIVFPQIPVTPFKFWLVIVLVSGISYASYLLKKFVFPRNSIWIIALLGGFYSSTATTLVLSRLGKKRLFPSGMLAAAIWLATGMMFIRIWLLARILHPPLASKLMLPLFLFAAIDLLTVFPYYKKFKEHATETTQTGPFDRNPLEWRTAFIFALLFVFFASLTQFTLTRFGTGGLQELAVISGLSDIDPFLVGIFTGQYRASVSLLARVVLISIASNNLMKTLYVFLFGDKQLGKKALPGFLLLILLPLLWIFFFI